MTQQEFKVCFDQYFGPLRDYLYYRSGDEALATDLTQDAFMRIWEKQYPYEGQRTSNLLFKIANDFLKSHWRHQQVEAKHLERLPLQFEDDTAASAADQQLKQRYEKALALLSEKQRTAFLLSRMNGWTYSEIAEHLTISIKAVEKRIHQALQALRKNLAVPFFLIWHWILGL